MLSLLQESIDTLKTSLTNEFMSSSSPMLGLPSGALLLAANTNNTTNPHLCQSTIENAQTDSGYFIERNVGGDETETMRPSTTAAVDSLSQTNIERVESIMPAYSVASYSSQSRLSRMSTKSGITQASERSSIWEASTFYSRAQTATTLYQTKSGKPFLPSTLKDYESNEMQMPVLETDLNVMPKDNLCILDSSDEELDYKLANAAYHGLAVLLKNAERFSSLPKLVDVLIERDFQYDAATNKEYVKFDDAELIINPTFRLILHVNAPLSFFSVQKTSCNNNLFQRLTSRSNAAHFVMDWTPSRDFIANDLLASIMEYEKYGYGNQISLADKILFEAEFNILNRQVRNILV